MKHILKLSILFIAVVTISSNSLSASVLLTPERNEYLKLEMAKSYPFEGMTIKDFLSLTPKRYKELSGKRLSLPQKLSLKLAQYKVKKMVKKNKQIDLLLIARDIDTNNFDILGFILGIVLGPLGVLIAYIIEGKNSSMFLWSVVGGLIWLGVFLLVVLVL